MNVISKAKLQQIMALYGLRAQVNVPLSELSHWKVGGNADIVVQPKNKYELIQLRQWIHENGLPSIVIGNTTNLLFADEGLQAVVIKIDSNFSKTSVNDTEIITEPGIWVPSLARVAMQAGLSGIEHTCGIPGTLGGLVVMNGGSQRKGIGSVLSYVETVDKIGNLERYTNQQCEFAYRSSIFQENDEVITEVGMTLERSRSKESIRKEMLDILSSRRKKFPRKQPNCGSVFVSNPDMYEEYGPPGKVIEECGLKDLSKGGAQVSSLHANFIINNGNAKAEDILYLINTIRKKVHQMTGYKMVVEAKFVTQNGQIQEI